jgi:hypothetical protein
MKHVDEAWKAHWAIRNWELGFMISSASTNARVRKREENQDLFGD